VRVGGSWIRGNQIMKRNLPQMIIMVSGATLLVCGIGLIMYQLVMQLGMPANPRKLELNSQGLSLVTNYVGLVVVAIGALLEVCGFVGVVWIERKTPPV
jgi:hypothetical protein